MSEVLWEGLFLIDFCTVLLREKICHSNVAIAVLVVAGFTTDNACFMPYWRPKVTQLRGGGIDWMKPPVVTDPIPTRARPTRRRHPDPH